MSPTAQKKAKDQTAERVAARQIIAVDPTTDPTAPATAPYSGCMVEVIDGEHQGRVGIFRKVLTADHETLAPKTILVHTRDDDKIDITVDYADCVRTKPGRR